jgi:hypothetical protein
MPLLSHIQLSIVNSDTFLVKDRLKVPTVRTDILVVVKNLLSMFHLWKQFSPKNFHLLSHNEAVGVLESSCKLLSGCLSAGVCKLWVRILYNKRGWYVCFKCNVVQELQVLTNRHQRQSEAQTWTLQFHPGSMLPSWDLLHSFNTGTVWDK